VIVTTTPSVEGREIVDYLGIVTGEVILGANIFRDMFASLRDVFGGRSGAYEQVLERGRREAILEMVDKARQLGGDALVGCDLDYQVLGRRGSMLMISINGTAVRLRQQLPDRSR
jgi:uncharacterized protein YbjQ (UPF0145 family)